MNLRFDFDRTAWFFPAFFLNVLFLGTSHVLSRLPIQYWALYVYVITNLSVVFRGDIQALYDAASLILALLTFALANISFRSEGRRRAFLTALQVSGISFLPLGIEIFIFDNPEWNLHVTEYQVAHNLAPWFTNADLFVSCLILLIVSTAAKREIQPFGRGPGSFESRVPNNPWTNRYVSSLNPISKFFLYKRHGLVREKMRDVHSKVLDVGCGLYRVRSDAIGIDIKAWKKPDVSGSVHSIPFPGDCFDCVTMLEVLEHMNKAKQSQALQEIERVLMSGGLFIMSMPNMSKWWATPYRLIWAAWEMTVQKEYMHEHIGMFSQDYVESLLGRYFEFLGSQRVGLFDRIYLCRKSEPTVRS